MYIYICTYCRYHIISLYIHPRLGGVQMVETFRIPEAVPNHELADIASCSTCPAVHVKVSG